MWNKKDLEAKLKYLNELSRNTKDEDKKFLILCDKATILEMLELLKVNRLKINTSLLIVSNKLSLKRVEKEYSDYQIAGFDKYSKDLEFSFELCKNIASICPFEEVKDVFLTSKEECFEEVIDFATKLEDKELKTDIISTLSDKDKIYITDKNFSKSYNGTNYELVTFKECYIVSVANSTVLLHEIIHGIDVKRNGSKTNIYPYSEEVPATALAFYKNMQVNDFSDLTYLIASCRNTLTMLFRKNYLLLNDEEMNFSDILVKNNTTFANLLTIKSNLIGFIFAKKILDDEENGLKDYNEMLNTRFYVDTTPNYSKWGITNDVIIDYSKNLITNFKEYIIGKKQGGKRL